MSCKRCVVYGGCCCAVLDESMRQLYDGGNGIVLRVVTGWMSSDSEHLQNSAALAIGNMARSGNNCDTSLLTDDGNSQNCCCN